MPTPLSRRRLLHSAGGLALATAWPAARACEFFAPHLRVWHPWTRASAEGATEAIVSLRFDNVTRDDRLIGVHTPVAGGARLAGLGAPQQLDLPIPAGTDTELLESGIHLCLVDLQLPLQVGRSYPLQLLLAVGGTVNAQLSIDFPQARFS